MFKVNILLGFFLLLLSIQLNAGPCELIIEDSVVTVSQEGKTAFNAFAKGNWPEAMKRFRIFKNRCPDEFYARDALYYFGVCHYNMKRYISANDNFSEYLKLKGVTKLFEDVLLYKFEIAEKFKNGTKKHIFNSRFFPRCIPADDEALEIYDEIAAGLPGSDLAAESLLSKAGLLNNIKEYDESEDTYQEIINRFPKTPFAAEAYMRLAKLYLKECLKEYQNPEYMALGRINIRKFQQDFPDDEEKTFEMEMMYQEMVEAYAQGLYETGNFYERIKKPQAAVIYYNRVTDTFPETKASNYCLKQLRKLNKYAEALNITVEQ